MVAPPLLSETEPPRLAQKQAQAEMFLEPTHLLPNGALRHAQFLCRCPERHVPAGGREGAQTVQGRQIGFAGHDSSPTPTQQLRLAGRRRLPFVSKYA